MKRYLHPLFVGGIGAAVLLLNALPSVTPVGAANLPHIVLHANGSARAITVVDRNRFLVDAMGFQSGEPVKIQATFPTYSGNTIVQNRTPTANPQGNVLNVSMYAPAGVKQGWTDLVATGQSSNKQAKGRVWVAYRPFIFLQDKSVTPGASVTVNGRAFVANTQMRVDITIRSTGGDTQTLSATGTADNNGNFTKQIRLPGYTSPGTYTVTATDTTGGFKRYAKLTVTQRPAPKPTATPTPVPHVSATVLPDVTLPNQDVTVSGSGFPGNATVTVTTTIDMTGGGNRYISKSTVADSNGNYSLAFRVPYKAAPGTYTVTASSSNLQASDRLQVLPRSAHPKNLSFRWTSLWYHTVRQGTWDYMSVQATLNTRLGIWVHVIFPSGRHRDYYAQTDNNGRWGVRFTIPRQSASRHSNTAYITFQLWHGKQTTQSFMDFTLV